MTDIAADTELPQGMADDLLWDLAERCEETLAKVQSSPDDYEDSGELIDHLTWASREFYQMPHEQRQVVEHCLEMLDTTDAELEHRAAISNRMVHKGLCVWREA